MRAIVATGSGAVGFGEVADPQPGPDEALVEVRAVSINRGEALDIADAPVGEPLGSDLVGVVVAPAESGGPEIGTRIAAFTGQRAWATHAAVPIRHLAPIPDGVTDETAAALPLAGLTALRLLRRIGDLAGRSVIVTGATGGVGNIAVQLAAAAGAKVIAVSRDAARGSGLRSLGAVPVVSDLADLTERVDAVLESVGGASLEHALRLVDAGGLVLTFGASSGESATLPPFWFGPRHDARLAGFTIHSDLAVTPAGPDLAQLLESVRTGALRPEIGLALGWEHADDAVRQLLDRAVPGKIVLSVS